jgi:hypothetical protein
MFVRPAPAAASIFPANRSFNIAFSNRKNGSTCGGPVLAYETNFRCKQAQEKGRPRRGKWPAERTSVTFVLAFQPYAVNEFLARYESSARQGD